MAKIKSLVLVPLVTLVTLTGFTHSAPSRVRYDQRQEGDLNVRADLENFVILVIPTSTGASTSALGLLDLLSKAIPMRPGQSKRQKYGRKPLRSKPHLGESLDHLGEDEEDETHFIESKNAPYQVDITKSRKNLAKLHPISINPLPETRNEQEELLVSPQIALIKSDDLLENKEDHRHGRLLRLPKGFVLSMPLEVEEDLVQINNKRIEKSKDAKDVKETRKKVDSTVGKEKSGEPKLKLLLLGAEHGEECGPGYERGENGVCQFVAHV